MRLNCYLRFFYYLSSYFEDSESFREYVMEFMMSALSEMCEMMGVEEEKW